MELIIEERNRREKRIRESLCPKNTPIYNKPSERAQTASGRFELPSQLVEEIERSISYTVSPAALKTAASLLTDFSADRDPGEFLQGHLPLIMAKHADFDVFMVVELFFECVDRKPFLDNIMVSFRNSPCGTSLDWSIFARCEFTAVTYLIFFESARIPPDNMALILTEFRWEGARHFYRFLLAELKDGTDLYVVMELVYSPEYIREKILRNLAAVRNILRRVINTALLAMNIPPRVQKRGTTVPKPFHFNITNTKLIDYELPMQIPFRAGVVPKTQFVSPRPSPRFEEALRRNREKADNLLLEVNNLKERGSVYGEPTKSERYLQSVARVKAQREAESAKRTSPVAPKFALDKVFQEPKTRGKTTYSELLRHRQTCMREELRRTTAVDELMVGRNEDKIRDYIVNRSAESIHMEELQRSKLVLSSKIAHQKAMAAPRRIKNLRQERARQIREEMHLDDLRVKQKKEKALKAAKSTAARIAQDEKTATKKAQNKLRKRRLQLAREKEELAAQREQEALEERKQEEEIRNDKLLRQRASTQVRPPSQKSIRKGVVAPGPKKERVDTMSRYELSLRLDRNKLAERQYRTARQSELHDMKLKNIHKIEQVKKDVEDCRLKLFKSKTVRGRPVFDLPPLRTSLDREVDLMKSEYEALRVHNEISHPKFKAKRQRPLRPVEFAQPPPPPPVEKRSSSVNSQRQGTLETIELPESSPPRFEKRSSSVKSQREKRSSSVKSQREKRTSSFKSQRQPTLETLEFPELSPPWVDQHLDSSARDSSASETEPYYTLSSGEEEEFLGDDDENPFD